MQNKEPKKNNDRKQNPEGIDKQKKDLPPIRMVLKTLKYFYGEAFCYQPLYFLFVTINILVNAFAPFINILIPKLLIDELMGDRRLNRLITLAILIVLGNALANTIKGVVSIIMEKYSDRFERYFKVKISEKSMTMDFENTENPDALEQASRAETGMSWYSGGVAGLTFCFMQIISNLLTIIGVITVLAASSPILLAVIVVGVLIRALINTRQNAINVKHFKGLVALNRAFGYIFWELSNFRFGKDIRLYGAKDMMLEKAVNHNEEQTRKWRQQSMEMLPLGELDVTIGAVSDGVIYFYLGYLAILKRITIGDFTMLIAATGSFAGSLRSVIWNLQELHKKSTFMQEFITFMKYKQSMATGSKPVPVTDEYEFRFVNVSFKYPRSEQYVLRNVNLTLSGKEHLSVVGLNGAGKTTFIKLLCRLYDVTEGEILLNGVNIKEYDYNEYMRLFSVVFQDYKLFAFSMKENVLLQDEIPENIKIEKKLSKDYEYLYKADDEKQNKKDIKEPDKKVKEKQNKKTWKQSNREDKELLELCEVTGLREKVTSLEKGLGTVLFKEFEEDGIVLSGGESQKLAIARALRKNAPIVILDEPTAALDPMAEYEIYNHFDRLVGGKTAVYISHRLSSCKFCDRIAVFSKETIAEYGTHEELLKIPDGIYAEMFAAQAQYYVD